MKLLIQQVFFSYELMFIKGYSKSRYFLFLFNCALLNASNARGLLTPLPRSEHVYPCPILFA